MLSKLVALVAVAVALTLAAGPALAADKTTMTGSVASIDKDHKGFTLKSDHEEQMHHFVAKEPGVVAKLKKGQHVQVTYQKDGSKMVAESVADKPSKTANKK